MTMRILCVYAHPDDESFGSASVLAKYARQGAHLAGVWATGGEHGQPVDDPPPTPAEMARLREQDLREAAERIGFADLTLLGYTDGTLTDVPTEKLQAQILDELRRQRPDVVLTFGPGGISGHPDHKAIHRAATAAFHQALELGLGVRELYYDAVPPERAAEVSQIAGLDSGDGSRLQDLPDGNPNTFVDVADTQSVKLAALRCHARHVADAVEMLERLDRQPQTVGTLYRAWPPVPEGRRVHGFLAGDAISVA